VSRTKIYGILKQDASATSAGTLGAIGLAPGHIYAGGVDSPQGELFVTIVFGDSQPGFGDVLRTNVTIWAYDRDRDYLRIEAILKRIRLLFESLDAAQTTEGWITSIRWTGDSGDLSDDVYRARARNADFMMVDSGR
jgi:hypothetical protein